MLQKILYFSAEVSEELQDSIEANPDKVYFPNFGSSDNIFNQGITIDKVAFTIPGTEFKVYWYGLLIAVGILLAMIYGFKRMKSMGIDPDRATDAVIAGFIGAILGARAYYIAFNDDVTFAEFFNYRDGGLAIYGGIIGAVVVGSIVAKLRKLKVTALLDVAAPCFLIGQAIGRWGNFANQEAFGSNTDLPWGMISYSTHEFLKSTTVSDDLALKGVVVDSWAPVHPCFLYESLWCVLCFAILHFYSKRRKFDGELFLMYIGLYGLGRFFIESTRTDSLYIANIKVSQLVAGTCVLASIILIIIFRSMVSRSNYKLFYQTELSKSQIAALDSYEKNEKEKKELKKKIAEARKNGESFAEAEKEYDEKFGKTAKEKAKKLADEKAAEKKELKSRIRDAKKSGDKQLVKELKNEYAVKFGGMVEEVSDDGEDEKYESILSGGDEEEADGATAENKDVPEPDDEKPDADDTETAD